MRGAGRFVDDTPLPGELHAYFLRSPHAHAKILSVDTEAAGAAPGVMAVLTAAGHESRQCHQHRAPCGDRRTW